MSDEHYDQKKKHQNNQMVVQAIKKGTVIDHIPINQGKKILKQLLVKYPNIKITTGFNLASEYMDKKDLIKIEHIHFTEENLNKYAVFAPRATINYIENYQVIKKNSMKLPATIHGLCLCPNSNCITNFEAVKSRFFLTELKEMTIFRCFYCEKTFSNELFSEFQ